MARSSNYVHPLPGLTHTGRVDMGVDYSATPGSRVLAIGRGVIDAIIPNWFKGQPLIEERLTEGPYRGRYVYYAEQIDPSVHVGQRVRAGQTIGRVARTGTGLELGFGAGGGRTAAQAGGGYTEGQVTQEGKAFARFIANLGGPTARPSRRPHTYSLADYWVQGGGAKNMAPIMAAIGMAESGGRIDATHTNDDGSTDDGWLQINSIHGYDRARLRSDPVYTARAGVAILRKQGLGAWTTYTSGAYRAFLGQASGALPTFGRPRPGGQPAGTPEEGGDPNSVFASYTQDASWHWNPLSPLPIPLPFKVPFSIGPDLGNPLNVFKDSANAVKDVGDFFKWIAWIFHPKNVLRVVEFLTGMTIMGFGLHTMIAVYKDAPEQSAVRRTGQATRRAAGEAFSMTPPGRAIRTTRAKRYGKRRARARTRELEAERASKKGRAQETRRQGKKGQKRDVRRAKLSREKVPF